MTPVSFLITAINLNAPIYSALFCLTTFRIDTSDTVFCKLPDIRQNSVNTRTEHDSFLRFFSRIVPKIVMWWGMKSLLQAFVVESRHEGRENRIWMDPVGRGCFPQATSSPERWQQCGRRMRHGHSSYISFSCHRNIQNTLKTRTVVIIFTTNSN